MGIFSKFEGKMEDGLEGAADRFFEAPISPVQISKKAEKAMRREKMVGAGKQYAPTLYTVLVNVEDDRRLFGYYPTLAGETETRLAARAAEEGLLMDGQPLVRFIADESLKPGKIDVFAELVSAPIVAQLREEEMERYGLRPQAPQQRPMRRPSQSQQNDQAAQAAQAARAAQAAKAAQAAQAAAQAKAARAAAAQAAAIEAAESAYRDRVRRASQSFNADSIPLVEDAPAQPIRESVLDDDRVSVPLDIPEVDEFAGLDVSTFEPYGEYGYDNDFDAPVRQSNTTEFAAGNAGVNPIPSRGAVRAALVFADTNRRVDLATNRLILGRSSGSDVVLDDINASRTHAELRLEPQGAWSITDLGSMNGTYVNKRAVTQAILTDGDSITIGSTKLFFVEE
ncbi:MAG: FHA domain-containing protein [Eggerthellaceae bacterium]|nr:FHA domain-containing protein [Eggerthellaceae bacterium]